MRSFAAKLLLSTMLASPAYGGTVKLQAEDGQALFGDHAGAGTDGVVLVHAQDRSAKDWTSLAEALAKAGRQVLAIDLRGHGRSTETGEQTTNDSNHLVADVHAAIGWMQRNGAERVSLIGAELGANIALNVAANAPDIEKVVLLSPGLNIRGVRTVEPIVAYANRPLLLIASRDDPVSAKAATLLEARAQGRTTLTMVEGGARGVRMLSADPTLEGTVLGWMSVAPDASLQTNDSRLDRGAAPTALETTGTLLEDRN